MKTVAMIPSRYGSSRFPGKPLTMILGKPMIQRVYENVSKTDCVDCVYVATDDQRIFNCVSQFGGNAIMTAPDISCGTDRIAICSDILRLDDEDVVLNIQGDEPLISSDMIKELCSLFDDNDVYMGTLKQKITKTEDLNNPNVVKVVTDLQSNALYFSRYCIPYEREKKIKDHYKHIGVYGYKKWFLSSFNQMKRTDLELSESLEQLRVIENGYKIRVKETSHQTVGVDTPEQIKDVEEEIKRRRK